jgi:hypothetical protein
VYVYIEFLTFSLIPVMDDEVALAPLMHSWVWGGDISIIQRLISSRFNDPAINLSDESVLHLAVAMRPSQ